jgi:tripartite-type tricarboxylate transporter receptor subunit TctC
VVNQALQTQPVREKLTQLGLEIVGGRSQEFGQLITRESRRWAEVARRVRIRAE